MPRLRRLTYRQVETIFIRHGFSVISQEGSHVKFRRIPLDGGEQNLMVPRQRQINLGTLRAIYRQAIRFKPEEELRRDFYTD